MSLLSTVPPEKAEGKLAELYTEVEQMFGMVPNNVRMLGVSPTILENQLDIVSYYMAHPALTVPFLAMVRMLVSNACNSSYCRSLNSGLLMKAGITGEQVQTMLADPSQAPLEPKEKALLLFVLKATKDPHSVTAQEVEALKSAGWGEVDIFDAVAHGARMVATNILFDTFKVDCE